MLQFKDFFPDYTKKMLGIAMGNREGMEQVLARANAWLASQSVRLVNVETVLVPSNQVDESSSGEELNQPRYNLGAFELSGGVLQVVRVWYQDSE